MDLHNFRKTFGEIKNLRAVHREYMKMLSGLCPTCILTIRMKGDSTAAADLCAPCKEKLLLHTARMNELLGGRIAELPKILRIKVERTP